MSVGIAMKDRGLVLIVEDDPACASILSRVAREMRLDFAVVKSIRDAFDCLARNKVRLVLLDRWLEHGADGLGLCLALKKDIRTRPIPVIVMTGLPDAQWAAYKHGADHFLAKPFSAEHLMACIKAFLDRLPYKEDIRGRIVCEDVVLNARTRTLTVGGRSYRDLPPRQFDFLAILAFHRGQTVSREYLVRRLWHDRVRDSEVSVLVCRLKRRLGTDASCIAAVRSCGYRLRRRAAA